MATTLLPADHLGLPATAAPPRRVAAALLSLCSLAADHPSMFEGCCGWRMEHGFRFLKQVLGWTTVRPAAPAAADRWTWLLALALWQLWLARALVADQRLPWERPLPPARLTPGRVRRAFTGLLGALGTPARPPKPRGKAPGRRPGQCPGPHPRHPVVRRKRERAA